jgi:hypothetical protein
MKTVRNVNKEKRRKRKHHYDVNTPVVFKWCGYRDYGYISELTKSKDGFATYTIRATGLIGCIYYEMEVDDPNDPYSFISSILTKSIKDQEIFNVKLQQHQRSDIGSPSLTGDSYSITKEKPVRARKKSKTVKVKSTSDDTSAAIKKQKDFLSGNVNKFWN